MLGMGGLFDNLDANGAPNGSVNAGESESGPQAQGEDSMEEEMDMDKVEECPTLATGRDCSGG